LDRFVITLYRRPILLQRMQRIATTETGLRKLLRDY